MMSFLSHSAFGSASEGSGRGEVVEEIFQKLFIDEYGGDHLPQITKNYKRAAVQALEHILFLEQRPSDFEDEQTSKILPLDDRLENLRYCLCASPMWKNTFCYWFSHFVKREEEREREEVSKILLSMTQG